MEFLGYTRPKGPAGTRNYVMVLPLVRCANELAWTIAAGVEGAVPLLHNHACLRLGEDNERAKRTFINLGRNPNVGAVVVAGFGCENVSPVEVAEEIARAGKPLELVQLDKEGAFRVAAEKGRAAARSLTEHVSGIAREPHPLSELTVGVKCGGSATISALTGHPATGYVLDALISEGGTAIFTETAEVIGAEHIMARRAIDEDVRTRLLDVVGRFERMILEQGVDIRGSQPNPGNIKAGLSTLEEKSLGAMYKTGSQPLADILEYAEVPSRPGLHFMDSTAWTPQLMLGMAAAGAQAFIFSAGGGMSAKCPGQPGAGRVPIVPVLKITGDPHVKDDLEFVDVYAGGIIEGTEDAEHVGKRLLAELLAVASGKVTKQEHSPFREILDMYATGPLL